MTTSKEKLINIYKEAKKKRVVLNQAEFAKLVGYSRIHLFKKMEEVPKSVIDKAQKLLETKNDSNTNNVIDDQADAAKELNRLIELSIKHEATLEVLLVTIAGISAELKGRAVALVSEELRKAINMRAGKMFDEYSDGK